METEVLLKIVEGSSAITLLAIGVLFLLSRRRNNIDHSKYVTQVEFQTAVVESRRLSTEKHEEVLEVMRVFGKEAANDRQNLFEHVSSHG